MFDAFVCSLDQFVRKVAQTSKVSGLSQLKKVREGFKESVNYMRDLCNDSGFSVSSGKQV